MQKKHLNKARRARTGMTGKAGETGKAGTQGTADRPENTGIAGKVDTLTPEQRRAKRLRDRKYRARKRAAERAALAQGRTVPAAEVETSAVPARRSRCRKCGGCGRGFGPDKVPADRMDPNSPCAGDRMDPNSPCADVSQGSAGVPPRAASAADVFSLIGKIVLGELVKSGVPSASPNCTRPVQVERGVTRQEISLPGGGTGVVTVVDGDEVDPLSPNSPLPWPIRRHLLLRRMAREISDIVDSHLEQS